MNKNKFEFQFHVLPFIGAFFVGLGYVYYTVNKKEKVVKKPTPFNNNDIYKDSENNCYKINISKTDCKGDEKEFELVEKNQ